MDSHFYANLARVVINDHHLVVTFAWWLPLAGIIAMTLGILLFRAMATGGLPWILTHLNALMGIRLSLLMTVPTLVPVLAGLVALWAWIPYKVEVDDHGIFQRRCNWHTKRGTWDQLWNYGVTEKGVYLEFFQGDTLWFTRDDFADGYPAFAAFVAERLKGMNMRDQQTRLLKPASSTGR